MIILLQNKMVKFVKEMVLLLLVAISSKGLGVGLEKVLSHSKQTSGDAITRYCLSWRMAVEANNVKGWRTIPTQCLRPVENYMLGGQYNWDVSLITDQIFDYLENVILSGDGYDAWILDIDDTCLSNLLYYRSRRFGCEPYNPMEFRSWAMKGECPAIPAVLGLFNRLLATGFKVMLVTGRDQETLGQVTIDNLQNEGFFGYDRLIMRSAEYRGMSAVIYKSMIREELVEQGYRIWGNVGDQWSDLQGNFTGDRTFKLPNPMYYVP